MLVEADVARDATFCVCCLDQLIVHAQISIFVLTAHANDASIAVLQVNVQHVEGH